MLKNKRESSFAQFVCFATSCPNFMRVLALEIWDFIYHKSLFYAIILNNLSDNRTRNGTSNVTLSPIFAVGFS